VSILGPLSSRNADKDIILITSERGADQGACYPNVISCVISILRTCL